MADENQLPLFDLDGSVEIHAPKASGKSLSGLSSFSKYIVYVDESGDHSLNSVDANYPIFVLAFCVFHKRHYSEAIAF